MTIDEALRDGTARLTGSSDTARLDAELLMAHALGTTRDAVLLGDRRIPCPASFAPLLARREAGEPVAYITGQRDFWTLSLSVTPAVLIPRPDSETLIEAALAHFRDRSPPSRILDLGTGSGALLLAALSEWPQATGTGIDISDEALAVARANAEALGMGDRALFRRDTWQGDSRADLILCNPPYIATDEILPRSVMAYEPAGALWAGADGLDDYREITAVLDFARDGVAVIEIGATQGESAAGLFRSRGFVVRVAKDLGDRDRCLIVTHATG